MDLDTGRKTTFADWISVSSVGIIMYPCIQYILTLDPAYAAAVVGLLATHLVNASGKLAAVKWRGSEEWTRRPDGARDCDMMCRNGDVSGKPGFPSGHMSTAAFFCVFIGLLAWRRHVSSKYLVLVCGCAYVVLTAYARLKKKCHNEVQVVAGALLGAVMGAACFAIFNAWTA